MTAEPRKSGETILLTAIKSIGLGISLIVWWIVSFEIPVRSLFKIIVEGRGGEMDYSVLTLGAYSLSTFMTEHRLYGLIFIFAAVIVNFISKRKSDGFDVWGWWLFRTGFLILYVILYGLFIFMFIGTEIPFWRIRMADTA